jgi:hypothetical protein
MGVWIPTQNIEKSREKASRRKVEEKVQLDFDRENAMDTLLEQSVNPESCRQVGKNCRECVTANAAVVAMLCPTLDAVGAQGMFFKMMRHAGCAPMARTFVREYLSATEPAEWMPMGGAELVQIAACA